MSKTIRLNAIEEAIRYKNYMPIFKHDKIITNETPIHDIIKQIPRCGCIFYTYVDNEIMWCLGRDKGTKELSDFGGHRKANESVIECMVREGNEESRKVFNKFTEEDIINCWCLWNQNMIIVFIPVISKPGKDICKMTIEQFNSKKFLTEKESNNKSYNEIIEIKWLTLSEINDLLFATLKDEVLYYKIRKFILSCSLFTSISNINDFLKYDGYIQPPYHKKTIEYYINNYIPQFNLQSTNA